MQTVREKGATGIWIFAGVMLVSILGGLGVGAFYSTPAMQDEMKASIGADAAKLPLISTDERFAGVAMRVNDRPVSVEMFKVNLDFMTRNYLQDKTDYATLLQIYGEAIRKLVRDEVLVQKGEELGVTVTAEEISEERNKIIDNFMPPQEDSTGNLVGDLAKNLNKNKGRREAFRSFLRANGLDNEAWEKNVRRGLLVTNSQKKITELGDAEKEQKMNETRLLIDERLAAGESFSDLAREFSDDSNAANGGDLNTWVFPGLVQDPDNDAALFATAVGETTEWFEIPAGLQRFEVYEKREASGPEFEAKRDELIAQVREEKGDDAYEPTEDEIAAKYRSVKARQIQLNKTDPTKAYEQIAELTNAAIVEVNVPYALAYQALADDRLYTSADVTFDDLVAIAKTAGTGENYDFNIIKPKWENRIPKAPEAEEAPVEDASAGAVTEVPATTTDESATTDETATADAVDAIAGEGAAEAVADIVAADSEPVASIEDNLVAAESSIAEADKTTPLYALAIGYLKMGQTLEGENPSMFSYALIASTYQKWLEDEDTIIGQQLDRKLARQAIEDNLAQVIKSDNYNAAAYASRGLNLAWLDRADEAQEQLALALKYVPSADMATMETIAQGYTQLDDQDGLAKLEEKRSAARQAQLQEQLENMKNNPGSSSIPFDAGQLQLPDMENVLAEDVSGEAADGDAGSDNPCGDAAGDVAENPCAPGEETPPVTDPPADG
jgi:hypothetical protein